MQLFVGKLAVIGSLLLIASSSVAAPCNDCHTIHNSQDGLPMRFDNAAQPLPLLLRATCIDCHTGTNSLATIAFPKVNSLVPPTYTWGDVSVGTNRVLAGGNFYYVGNFDFLGHNVSENTVAGADAQLGNIPPGGLELGGMLQCAGTNGCHGDTAVASALNSLGGAHHTNATGVDIDGSTVAKSYRFLNGVLGWEDDDWEFTSSATDHNRYVGQARTADTQQLNTTIGGFCSTCHNDFHNTNSARPEVGISYNNNFASPWLRHPNDFDMTTLAGTEYDAYNTYDTRVPVARTGGVGGTLNNGLSSDVGPGQGIIMCLTCHRAHGSPYYASLRWNYRIWPGTDPVTSVRQDGCQICHTSKN